MKTRKDVIEYCLSFLTAYEDYPFDDFSWTVMRRRDTTRGFAWIFERGGRLWVNLKAEPNRGLFWRGAYDSVQPAYHMNKEHWISVILDGTVPDEDVKTMISDSYFLCGKKGRGSC